MKYYNTNEGFGEKGPFEAENREKLADEMMPIIRQWAEEEFYYSMEQTDNCLPCEKLSEAKRRSLLKTIIARTREEFIEALEEVES